MIRQDLLVFREILLALLILAAVTTWIISAVNCLLPPFNLLTLGSPEGAHGRCRFRMMKGAVVVEAWTIHEATAVTPSETIDGMFGFYFGDGVTRIMPGEGISVVRSSTEAYRRRVLGCPGWFLVMVFTSVPSLVFWRRGRRHEPGHCGCGYDLTGNVSGRCPECGGSIS